jgi:gliding motility-associated-like protein
VGHEGKVAFTPNNDGLNDILIPVIANFPANVLFRVYNRFGENIFSTTNLNDGWNGMYKSILQPTGTYIWTCNYTTVSGIKKISKGTVSLIR